MPHPMHNVWLGAQQKASMTGQHRLLLLLVLLLLLSAKCSCNF
jgi:hypothetical protein